MFPELVVQLAFLRYLEKKFVQVFVSYTNMHITRLNEE